VVGESAGPSPASLIESRRLTLVRLQFSEDLEYWRNNNYHIEFQNHAAGFVLTGDHIRINGHGTGGIHGNGQVWYWDERNETKGATVGATRPGRPMPFVLWNVSDVDVRNFHVVQPQLWAINMMNATNIVFDNIYVNATSPEAPDGVNWVQNTDGFSEWDVTG
jgi:galacturan 1,4-alpha-galacturonidase